MKYSIDINKLRDVVSEKINNYMAEEKSKFMEVNKDFSEIMELEETNTLEGLEKEMLEDLITGVRTISDISNQRVIDTFTKLTAVIETFEKKVNDGVYDIGLFTLEEIQEKLSFSLNDVKNIVYGKEE